jgi:hypothetical protein
MINVLKAAFLVWFCFKGNDQLIYCLKAPFKNQECGLRRGAYKISLVKVGEREHLEDLGVDGNITVNWFGLH